MVPPRLLLHESNTTILLSFNTLTVKNGVHGNPILRCPGNTGCTTPHGVFPFHLEEVFSYTPVHPSLYQWMVFKRYCMHTRGEGGEGGGGGGRGRTC